MICASGAESAWAAVQQVQLDRAAPHHHRDRCRRRRRTPAGANAGPRRSRPPAPWPPPAYPAACASRRPRSRDPRHCARDAREAPPASRASALSTSTCSPSMSSRTSRESERASARRGTGNRSSSVPSGVMRSSRVALSSSATTRDSPWLSSRSRDSIPARPSTTNPHLCARARLRSRLERVLCVGRGLANMMQLTHQLATAHMRQQHVRDHAAQPIDLLRGDAHRTLAPRDGRSRRQRHRRRSGWRANRGCVFATFPRRQQRLHFAGKGRRLGRPGRRARLCASRAPIKSSPRRTRSPARWSGRSRRSRTSFTKPSMRCTRRDTSTKPVRLASPLRVWLSRKNPAGSTPLVSKSIHARLRRPSRSAATWRNVSRCLCRRAS